MVALAPKNGPNLDFDKSPDPEVAERQGNERNRLFDALGWSLSAGASTARFGAKATGYVAASTARTVSDLFQGAKEGWQGKPFSKN